jgi:hypothetical protein
MIQEKFDEFIEACYPDEIPQVQYDCLREAFFGGALIAHKSLDTAQIGRDLVEFHREIDKKANERN